MMKTNMNNEKAKCECGNMEDIDHAVLTEDGQWTCSNCQIYLLRDQVSQVADLVKELEEENQSVRKHMRGLPTNSPMANQYIGEYDTRKSIIENLKSILNPQDDE